MQLGVYRDSENIFYHFDPAYDFLVIGAAALFFYFLRIFCVKLLFGPLARILGCTDAKELSKFNQNAYYALYYTGITITGYVVLWNESWVWDKAEIFRNFPHDKDHINNPYLRPYYLAELGFYLQALFSHWFVDERLKDFHILTIHHLATIFLVFFSIVTGYHRVGAWILLLHDVVDIFLYFGKMVKACKLDTLATGVFALFISSYAYFRLYLFSGLIYLTAFCPASISKEYNEVISRQHISANNQLGWYPLEITSRYICVNRYCVVTPICCVYALVLLLCLHVYWFSLIMSMVYKMLKTGDHVDDVREKAPKHGKQH